MIFLSNAALRYAVEVCAEIPSYQVIVTALTDKLPGVQRELINLANQICGTEVYWIKSSCKSSCNRTEIYLKNGSHIMLTPANESMRGYSSNLLIADRDIDRETLETVFYAKEILDMFDYNEYHRQKGKETL